MSNTNDNITIKASAGSNVQSDSNSQTDNKTSGGTPPERFGNSNGISNISNTSFNYNGISLSKNPRLSYYNAKTKYTTNEENKTILEKISNNHYLNYINPSFHNTVIYEHRKSLYDEMNETASKDGSSYDTGYLRIGCCIFKIPPEFISVSEVSNNSSIPTIRNSSSLTIKSGYSTKTVSVNLILNGINQINGYEVDSPFDYNYYVDGLRALLAQFKFTPFVPVENVFLNIKHDIHAVALKNIQVQTIPNFPNSLNVSLTLEQFVPTAYTQAPSMFFDDSINWDLFNFYIQRCLHYEESIGLKRIKNQYVDDKVIFRILKQESITDSKNKYDKNLNINLLEDKYYDIALDTSKDNLNMTNLTFSTGNKLPKIQMSYYENPTYQFLGSTDTEFIMEFETTDDGIISKIKNMNSENLALARNNKHKSGIGFIKIENDLLNLAGVSFITIGNITTSTVPGFPGLYTIAISGSNYDTGQKDAEKFKKMRPFYASGAEKGTNNWLEGRKGTRNDLITQSKKGLANKVVQDATIEAKLMCIELYPDLRLPKYSALDWALGKIKVWREKNNLDPLPFYKYPRPKSYIPGSGNEVGTYNGYADPDFYVMYNFQSSEINVDKLNQATGSTSSNSKWISEYNIDTFKSLGMSDSGGSITNYSSASNSNLITTLLSINPKPDVITEPSFVPGYEPEQQLRIHKGYLNEKSEDEILIEKLNSWVKTSAEATGTIMSDSTTDASGGGTSLNLEGGQKGDPTKNPKQVDKVTGNPFVDLLINRAYAKCGYVYGASQNGDICTEDLIQSCYRRFGSIVNIQKARQWIGRQVWDCSSFVCWGLIRIGLKPSSFKITSGSWGTSQGTQLEKGTKNLQVGDLLYGGGHIIVYIGDGRVVHASGHSKGVTFGKVSDYDGTGKCQLRCRVTGLKEACDKFLKANPNFYATASSSSSSSSGSTSNSSTASNNNSTGSNRTAQASASSYSPEFSVMYPVDAEGNRTSTTSTNTNSSYSTGAPVLGKFGNEPIKILLLGSNGKEKSSKNTYNGSKADQWDSLVLKYSKLYNLDPNFVKCILMIESNGNPKTISPANCYGLMQVHQGYFPIKPDPLDPDANIKMGCKVLYDYGKSTSKPKVNFDRDSWIICYNAGPGSLSKIQRGEKSIPLETKNYIRKFIALYSRLISSGGKPGNTNAPTVGGMKNPTLVDESNIDSSTGSGAEGSGGTTTQTIDIDVTVKTWFEMPKKDLVTLDKSNLENKFKSTKHVSLLEKIKKELVGESGSGATFNKGLSSSTSSSSNSSSRSISSTYEYIEPEDINLDAPTQAEFGVGLIDSLNDGELDIDKYKISEIEDFKNNNDDHERMFVDMCQYGQKGRLVRAFPSYIFMVIDEHNGWINEQKFWSNYYLYQSVLDLDIHESYDMPIATAKVTLSNVYKNITKFNPSKSLTSLVLGNDKKMLSGDSDFSAINQISYAFFGSLITEEITDSILNMRNELWEDLYIKEGSRIHIRLGYGSNPSRYATKFSGIVTEIANGGDLITIAAQSDGAELVSTSVTDRTNATNKDVGLPEEPSDIIAMLLCNRENEFLYTLSMGNWFIENSYGITHYGLYSSGKGNGGLLTTGAAGGEPYTLAGGMLGVVGGGLIGGIGGAIALGLLSATMASNIRRDRFEYDIVKNIYKGTYDGRYIYEPQLFCFDGETNMRFFCFNRTPWDIMKMCEKMMPEFVCYPRYYGFENRIFYGLPWWQCKYKYERDDKTNSVYEFSKSFSQVNILTSISDIIDNQISLDSTNLKTNMIGIYSLGGDLASTPVVMSDDNIDIDKQKTATIDTTSTQDFNGIPGIVDKLLEWTGTFDNGKHNAIRVCISELIDSWKRTYSGCLITIGAPEVSCNNYIYISDKYAKMEGLFTSREVVHSLSGDRGYITTTVPGLIATSKLKSSGATPVLSSITTIASKAAMLGYAYACQVAILEKVSKNIASNKLFLNIKEYGGKSYSFLKTKGASIIQMVKDSSVAGKIVSLVEGLTSKIGSTRLGGVIMNAIGKIASSKILSSQVVKIVASIGLKLTGAFIVQILISRVFTLIQDMFKYRNCISLLPMYLEEAPMIAGASGQKDMYPLSESNTESGDNQ